jgi:uncharacterized protein with PQ loop repeat
MQIVGWISSAILAVTIIQQVWKQWKHGSSEGVSLGLFAGQCLANLGFIAYSLHTRDWVFTFTNCLLLAANLVGYGLTLRQRKQEEHASV